MFNRDLEFSSSQPQQLEALQSKADFSAAMQALAEAGAESIYTARDRLVASFRPFNRKLLSRNEAARVFDLLEKVAGENES
jgi:hypothetical protein